MFSPAFGLIRSMFSAAYNPWVNTGFFQILSNFTFQKGIIGLLFTSIQTVFNIWKYTKNRVSIESLTEYIENLQPHFEHRFSPTKNPQHPELCQE